MTAGWRVGIDIGGTFTDVVAADGAGGALRIAKVATTPGEPLRGLAAALAAVGLGWEDVAELVHGTTMVTNAMVEGRLARVALVATRGFADVLDIARASRRHLYRLDLPPRPAPDVPDGLKFEVGGRMDAAGAEVAAPAPADLAALPGAIAAAGAGAVAVALLHSYANPDHERKVAAALAGRVPFLSLSHAISPEAREYERTATTVLNAAVMPMVARYMDRLTAAVPARTRVQLFHSAGGMIAPALVRERPLALALSGPAAGAAAAAAVARDLGLAQAISFDMGGTTTDVCLIRDGAVEVSSNRAIAGRPIRQPIAAIETIGAGGGSIVALLAGGLAVGPASAGADPGPACYGLGGTAATIADADLVLGYLDPARPLGGRIHLRPEAARQALAPVAAALGRDIEATALGVVEVAHALMARALRRVSVDRGIDARDCALIAFGGAGPMHACGLADATGIGRIVVPAASGAFSALGCTTATARHVRQHTLRLASRGWSEEGFARRCRAVEAETLAALSGEQEAGGAGARLERVALVRYAGQSGTVEVALGEDRSAAAIGAGFRAAHRRLYGFATGEEWILEALRVTASRPRPGPAPAGGCTGARRNLTLTPASCRFDGAGARAVPRHWRSDLDPGARLAGPRLIVDDWSTTVVAPGFAVAATAAGHLLVEREGRP
ncbi:MAG: hydantoinase/oxoprolinase family protein [Rhodobacteraceae bacterium]|nr:hydantoinase/oxoprolinase family protein [Paracoccaceae bacterium]